MTRICAYQYIALRKCIKLIFYNKVKNVNKKEYKQKRKRTLLVCDDHLSNWSEKIFITFDTVTSCRVSVHFNLILR